MKKSLFYFGIIPIILLLIALITNMLHFPNYAILIILGILLFLLIELPIFLVSQNRNKVSKKGFNILTFISLFIFTVSLFFYLENHFVPQRIVLILSILSGTYLIYFIINEIKNKRFTLKKISFLHLYLVFIALIVANMPIQLQAPDYQFSPKIDNPIYTNNDGPIIYFDEGHNNFHTLNDRLFATEKILNRDGYKVLPLNEKISIDKLKKCKIFAIINALNTKNVDDWQKPIYSAFEEKEIADITQWVQEGGSLLLVADHMPFPGAIYDLANKFGFVLENGHADDKLKKPDYFIRTSNTLHSNCITNGRNSKEAVDSIRTFGGCAFKFPEDATPILIFDSTYLTWNPEHAWDFENVKPISIKGYSQGAFKEFGKGRVAVFGEAMMFTAQLGAGLSWIKIGMNSNSCPNNYKLLLNTIHWLDRKIDNK